MNRELLERIAKEAGFEVHPGSEFIMVGHNGHITEKLEKFLLAIVRECGDVADNYVDHGIPSSAIEIHFGFE